MLAFLSGRQPDNISQRLQHTTQQCCVSNSSYREMVPRGKSGRSNSHGNELGGGPSLQPQRTVGEEIRDIRLAEYRVTVTKRKGQLSVPDMQQSPGCAAG